MKTREDIRVDTLCIGGSHINKPIQRSGSLIRRPGIVVCQDDRSQHKKSRAMSVLAARIKDARARTARQGSRDPQTGWIGRSFERVRTYNFQGRVTDHRINLTLHKIDQIGTAIWLRS